MKKQIFTFLALLWLLTLSAQKINWLSFEDAIELQKKKPKKIMIDMYTNWCGPCRLLDKNTFQNKDVANYVNNHYYAVKFNAEGDDKITFKGKVYTNPNYNPAKASRRNSMHQLARHFKINAYPTIVFLGEKAELLTPLKGYRQPRELELYLKMFKNDEHKNLTSKEAFNEYYKAFKPEFEQ